MNTNQQSNLAKNNEPAAAARARALQDRRRHYAGLHHAYRLQELEAKERLDSHDCRLMDQSRAYLANPGACSAVFDLDDTAYIAELDAYAAQLTHRHQRAR